jgi:catechol 2,3-dioxygenase-like lactoylglutathione lyase family enzyme
MTGRVQLALNVNDLAESVAFYTKLFGTEPAKVRPGYANFAITEPPLKLVLLENPGQGGSLNHLGVEVADTGAVEAEQTRLAEAGLAATDERDTTCCYARQDKFWVTGTPNGEHWEIYTVLQDSATFWGEGGQQGRDAAGAQLDSAQDQQDQQDTQCRGGSQTAGEEDTASSGVCCGIFPTHVSTTGAQNHGSLNARMSDGLGRSNTMNAARRRSKGSSVRR